MCSYDIVFPDTMRVERAGTSLRRGGISMNWLKAMTSVDNCLRSTSPCGRDVKWLECSRRVVRLREERGRREERKRGEMEGRARPFLSYRRGSYLVSRWISCGSTLILFRDRSSSYRETHQ